jgi:two-component system NtrC family sensor kinase
MPDGGELTIKAGPSAAWANGAMVEGAEIEVSDTGNGIEPENIEQVFTPFFSTKERKGTGLGLSIVQGIISDHGGNVRVESALEKGTTFTIFLPAGGK